MNRSPTGIRILWWSDTYWPHIGGIEVLATHLLPRLIEKGLEIVVVTSHHDNSLPDEETHDDVSIRRFPFHEALRGHRKDLWTSAMTGVHRLKSEFRPDVVHLNFPSPSCMFHLSTEKARKAPTVVAIHTAIPANARGPETLTHRMLSESAWVIANSQAMHADVLSIAPEISRRSSIIYNGSPFPDLAPAPLSFDPPVVACIARLVEKKGVDVALRAFAMVKRRIRNATMIVVGDGPERDRLHALALELELSDSVEFMGWVDPGETATVINRATLVLVPSRDVESFGMAALEGMQMSRPVVVTDRGGLPEVVTDGETGFVVPASDPESLAEGSIRILENHALGRKLGAAGRKRAEERFSIERCVDAYEALYRRLAIRPSTPE